jgi:hypothetical protein
MGFLCRVPHIAVPGARKNRGLSMLRKRNHIREFMTVTMIGLCIDCANVLMVANSTTYRYAIELWNYGEEFLHILYPIVFSAPFCWLLFHERHGGYWKNMYNRSAFSRYLRRRILTAIWLSAAAMFLVSALSLPFAYWIAPLNVSAGQTTTSKFFYGSYQLNHPVLYALILSCWRSVLAALYTAMGAGITMISGNIFLAMTGPFVYSIAENFVTAILRVPALSICTSFYPNRLSGTAVTFPKLLVGPLVMLLAIVSIYAYYRRKIKRTLLD